MFMTRTAAIYSSVNSIHQEILGEHIKLPSFSSNNSQDPLTCFLDKNKEG